MALALAQALAVTIIVSVLLTLTLFSRVIWLRYDAKQVFWNRMNRMAAVGMCLTLFSSVPQLFLTGRTATECAALHHCAITFYHVTHGVVRVFFLARSNAIVEHDPRQARLGRRLLRVWIALTLIGVVGVNLTMAVVVQPAPIGICLCILDPVFSLLFAVVVPRFFDLVIHVRFALCIVRSSQATQSMTSAKRRLVALTFVLCAMTMAASLMTASVLLQLLPIADPLLITPILAAEQAFTACMMVWPVLIIRSMNAAQSVCRRHWVGMVGKGSDRRLIVVQGTRHHLPVDK